ncbi:UNVERIFIED_CONTAM: hypothetical protein GTU68_046766 [Idotea baltica]|nr:hypothetical protein [Idotea baltica]
MSTFAVIIPAAGQSRRFVGFDQKKPFVELLGVPIWLRTVDHFVNCESVVEIILVLAEEDRSEFETKFAAEIQTRNLTIVSGGASRAESVRNGMQAVQSQAEWLAVHDAARPLLTSEGLNSLFTAALQHGSVIPGIPVTSTVKRINSKQQICETVDRESLRIAQTPQVFRRDVLWNAFESASDLSSFTDEASVVEATGSTVTVHPGWPENIKITTADDFRLAESWIKSQSPAAQ